MYFFDLIRIYLHQLNRTMKTIRFIKIINNLYVNFSICLNDFCAMKYLEITFKENIYLFGY